MIPGEMLIEDGDIELNVGRRTTTLSVANSGDRPIQIGSHYHFYETNPALLLGSVILGSMAFCVCVGLTVERIAYRPLRSAPRLNVLITAIGVSLLLRKSDLEVDAFRSVFWD